MFTIKFVQISNFYCFKKNSCCAKKIISKGIKKVVIASLDPNPLIHGKGVKFLKTQGIQVILAGPHQNKFHNRKRKVSRVESFPWKNPKLIRET